MAQTPFAGSHPLKIVGTQVQCVVPSGEAGWAVPINAPLETIALDTRLLDTWLKTTLNRVGGNCLPRGLPRTL